MATFAPGKLVRGAVRQPLPYGIFSVLNFDTPIDPHWQLGVKWDATAPNGPIDSLGHPSDTGAGPTAPAGRPSTGLPKNFGMDTVPDGVALPFTVYGHWKVTPIGYTQEESEFKALEHLTAFEEIQVEDEFWTGGAQNVPNLTTGITNIGTGTPEAALMLLEDYVASNHGSLGVIHMARSIALKLFGLGLLETKGTKLLTGIGTPVVAGGGYPDTHMRATPGLFGLRSEVFYSSRPGSPLIDVRNNDLFAVAERTYLIGFDPTGTGSVTLS